MAKPPAKKRPYDAMRDESSRAITAMPYTEDKPKSKSAPKTNSKKRPYDHVKDEPTSRPFKRGGKVVRKAEGGLSKLLTPKRLRGRDGPSDTLAFTPKMDTEGLRGMPSIDSSKLDTTPKNSSSSQTFSEAFRAARKAGKSDFSWGGKEYTTKLKGETKTPPKTATPTPAPTKKPPTFGKTVARAAGSRGEKKPEPPSSGAANRAAYKDMMAKSDAIRSKESQKTGVGRLVDYLAKGDPRYRDLPAGKRFGAAFRDTMSKAKGGKVKAKKRYV